MGGQDVAPQDQFDWIQLRKDMDDVHKIETMMDKVQRKSQENPFVPIGCLATVAALSLGLYTVKTGNRVLSQRMMRLRIAAQGLTVVALITGVIMAAPSNKKE